MKIKLITLTLLMFLTNTLSFAQETPGTKLTELAVEISHGKGVYPRYWKISDDNNGISLLDDSGLFHKIPNYESSKESQSVKQILLNSIRIDNSVKIQVLIVREIDNKRLKELLAEFTMVVNEKRIVSEIKEFGLEPIEIKIIKVVPDLNRPPEIINNTSLSIVNIKAVYPPVPTYRITLQNNSAKPVKAVIFRHSTRNGAGGAGTISFEQNEVIHPGEHKEITISNPNESVEIRKSRNDLKKAEITITISSIIFDDNSYEGDESESANYVSPNMGYKIQAENIIKLLEEKKDTETLPANIKIQAEKFNEVVNESDFIAFINNYPSLSKTEVERVKERLNQKISETRRNFLLKLDYLIKAEFTLDQEWFDREIENYKMRMDEN